MDRKVFAKQFAMDTMARKDEEILKLECDLIKRMRLMVKRCAVGSWPTFDADMIASKLAQLTELKKNRAGADELFQILFDQDEE